MAELPPEVRALFEGANFTHLATLNDDGSPSSTAIWAGLEGDDVVFFTQEGSLKARNMERDPRVAVSFEGAGIHPPGLKEYLVVHGRARITEGGAPELLQRLAHVHLGPDVKFPPMPDPPPGFVTHIAVERIGGVGPWTS